MKKAKCIECQDEFKGRADKKFCSTDCRSAYNNRLNRDSSNFMRNINNIIRKNRRILAQLNPNGKVKVTREKMMDVGFNFNYYTNVYETQTGNRYHFCYDQGYLELDDGMYALVERQKYVV